MERVRTAWISDVHLGTRGSSAEAFMDFLRRYDIETLYIVGDFIDIWSLKRARYWPQAHNDVIQKVLRKARKGTHVVYIPGNHDEFVTHFAGQYGGIDIRRNAIHVGVDGRRFLVMHGHELDTVVQNMRWLAFVGDVGYQTLLLLNRPVNWIRRILGRPLWSLSAYVKMRVKDAVSFIGRFEEEVVRYAERYDVAAVVCGHIHAPAMRKIGAIEYLNCGDWVETRSAILEHYDGRLELVTDQQRLERGAEDVDAEAEPEVGAEPQVVVGRGLAGAVLPLTGGR